MILRLGVLTTHPIQYQVPWFRALAREPGIDLTVLYCLLPDAHQQGDGFGVPFQWDVPLLGGYEHQVLKNVASQPSVTRFTGCDTPGIGRVLRQRPFHALIVNGWVVKSCLQALWACRRQGIPCLVRGESNALQPRPWWVRRLHRTLLSQYAGFLVIGEANRRFYEAAGVGAEKLFPTPYGVDNAWFQAQAERLGGERDQIRAAWGVPGGATAFLFCGKLIPKKRPLDVLQALRLLRDRQSREVQAHVIVAGDGPLRNVCEVMARELGLPVTFTGFLNQGDVVRAYVAADCLVLPSDHGETWGLVVNEAMACGRPAIVSDRVGCHLDLIRAGQTGAVYPLGDTGALAAAMQELTRPGMAARLGAGARGQVATHSVARVVQGILEALGYVAAQARAAA